MARRKKHQAHENHERWLVSYADFITLLFAFFVVMFANAETGKSKSSEISESVKKAFKEGKMAAVVNIIMGGTSPDKGRGNAQMRGPGGSEKSDKPKPPFAELTASLKDLTSELKQEIDKGKINVHMEPRGLAVSFEEAALFASGDAVVGDWATESIQKVADALNKVPNPVRLEGHTDSVPIHNTRFHSNWDLSAARSVALLELLTEKYSVPRERLSIAGYADTAPVASNDTLEGRARNRRCEILIMNETGAMGDPKSHGKAAK